MKQTKSLILLLALLTLSSVIMYAQKGPDKQGWKPCKGLPPITQTGPFSGNLKAMPTNAPCYVDITAEAEGVSSAPIRIYIKK